MSHCGEDVACISGDKFKVCFSNLGEGHHGDYNPNDPDDEQLLRIDIWEKTSQKAFHGINRREIGKKTEWEIASDGSACTGITSNAPVEHLESVLKMVLDDLERGSSSSTPRYWADEISWFDNERAAMLFKNKKSD